MIIQVGATLRIRSAPRNWVVEAGVTYQNEKGEGYLRWRGKGYHASLDSAFVHCGRHFLEQIDGEFGTDALPVLFDLTDTYKRLGQEAVAKLPAIPG